MNMIFTFIKSTDIRILILCLAAMIFLSISASAQGSSSCTMACRGQINATLDPTSCTVELTTADLYSGSCTGDFLLEILSTANQVLASGTNEVAFTEAGDFLFRVTNDEGVACWGNISIEDKSAPVKSLSFSVPVPTLVCGVLSSRPSGVNDLETEYVSCVVPESGYSIEPWFDVLTSLDFTDCSGIQEVYNLTTQIEYCDEPNYPIGDLPTGWEPHLIYTRGWYAIDIDGNFSDTCYQDVIVLRPLASIISIESHIMVECSDVDSELTGPYFEDLSNTFDFLTCPQTSGAIVPLAEGLTCGYIVTKNCEDEVPTCKQGVEDVYKELCRYTVIDWCTGEKIFDKFSQLFEVKDEIDPIVFEGEVDFISEPFDCSATIVVGPATAIEECSGIEEWTTIVEYGAISHIGGFFDRIEVPQNGTTLSDIPAGAEVKITWRATDGCHNIGETSTMLSPMDKNAPVCIANDEVIVGLIINDPETHTLAARVYAEDIDDSSYDNCQDIELLVRRADAKLAYIAAGLDPDELWAPYVEFSDEDLIDGACESTYKVELLVREDRLGGLSTECFGLVTIENKTAPIAKAPEDVYVDCNEHIPAFGNVEIWGGCNNDFEVETETLIDDDCNYDVIYHARRTWTPFTIVDGARHYGAPVSQSIKVNKVHDIKMEFPLDMEVSCNADGTLPDALTIDDILTDYGCSDWQLNVSDKTYIAEDEADCKKIIREYEFINWCTWDYNRTETAVVNRPDDLILVDSQKVNLRYRDSGNERINDIDDADAEDMDIYDQFGGYVNDGAFVLIDNYDTVNGLQNYTGTDGINGGTANYVDGYLYGRFVYRQVIKIVDEIAPVLSGGIDSISCDPLANSCTIVTDVVASFSATDNCSVVDLSYQLLVDGTDTPINDPFGSFDGTTITGRYPAGTHAFVVTARDGCNNLTVKSYEFTAGVECKKPTPVALATFTALMENGMVEIWASDVESGSSYDNCTDYEDLEYAVQVISDENGDGVITSADVVKEMPDTKVVRLTCADLPKAYVALWVRDEAGNKQFAITPIYVTANDASCTGAGTEMANVTGVIANEYDEEIENVMINVNGSGINAQASMFDGLFSFDVPMNANVTIAPAKDDNYLNGVSTSDLVMLQRHILGVKTLNSAYSLIAADANNDEKVDTRDMLHVSRLILGVYQELPNNSSWRFVDKNYTFANPTSPWGFAEAVDLSNLSVEEQADFIGIKIGDLSGNAKASNLLGDDVKVGSLNIAINDASIQANEISEIAFTAADFNNIAGFQFSINLTEGVELLDVVPGVLPNISEANFGMNHISEGVLTTSWANANAIDLANDEVLFTLKIRSANPANVSEIITINSAVTAAEAYDNDLNVMDVHPLFNRSRASEMALYQNTPNPFNGTTTIGFDLPENGTATLKVLDISGRTISVISGEFNKGYNQVELSKSDLNATGVLYYELTSSNTTMTKKMVVLK